MVPLVAGVLALASMGFSQQSKPAKKHGKIAAAPAPPALKTVPFKSGENLDTLPIYEFEAGEEDRAADDFEYWLKQSCTKARLKFNEDNEFHIFPGWRFDRIERPT